MWSGRKRSWLRPLSEEAGGSAMRERGRGSVERFVDGGCVEKAVNKAGGPALTHCALVIRAPE